MAHDENSFLDAVREDLETVRKPGGFFWLKIHGGPYQAAGIADVLCAVPGACAAVEFKWAAKAAQLKRPIAELFLRDLLTDRQRQAQLLLARIRSPLNPRLLLGCELVHNVLPGGRADYAFAVDYAALSLLPPDKSLMDVVSWDLATWAEVNVGERAPAWLQEIDRVSVRQLRKRGEKWASEELVFGGNARVWQAVVAEFVEGQLI